MFRCGNIPECAVLYQGTPPNIFSLAPIVRSLSLDIPGRARHGSLLATGVYLLIRKLEYWTVTSEADGYESKIGNIIMEVEDRV
jgi:hypothetical protein